MTSGIIVKDILKLLNIFLGRFWKVREFGSFVGAYISTRIGRSLQFLLRILRRLGSLSKKT